MGYVDETRHKLPNFEVLCSVLAFISFQSSVRIKHIAIALDEIAGRVDLWRDLECLCHAIQSSRCEFEQLTIENRMNNAIVCEIAQCNTKSVRLDVLFTARPQDPFDFK